ncbi:MEMO1 family protein [Thermogymnomonas acidicola]|nr:MEMO1 family protein [Thermogymnomonas acidicola]
MRVPAVAGTFYPNDEEQVISMLAGFEKRARPEEIPGKVIGVIVPHAGYIYSGLTAMYSYRALSRSQSRDFLIIGPNHNGYPSYSAVYPEGVWLTPLGRARVDEDLARDLCTKSRNIVSDKLAHAMEHSIEVQVPFLQYLFGDDFSFVPVAMGDQGPQASEELYRSISALRRDVVLIASSDFTHYEPHEVVVKKDMELIERIIDLDIEGFYRTLRARGVTACGYGPIAVLMHITAELGGRMKLLHHSTSGEASGDMNATVGYGSVVAYL